MEQITAPEVKIPTLRVKIKAMAYVRMNSERKWGMSAIRARQNGDKPPRVTTPLTTPELFETIVEVPDLYIKTHKVSYHSEEARKCDDEMKQRMQSLIHLEAHYAWTAEQNKRMKEDPAFLAVVRKSNAIGAFKEFSWEVLPD